MGYKYYMKTGDDAMLESSYPYTSGGGDDSTDCLYDASETSSVTVSSYVDVTPSNPSQMMAALNTQPLAVAIEADKMVFQTYKSGVLTSSKCGTNLDHAVLAVGSAPRTARTTGSLRTPGTPPGVTRATS